MHSPITQDLVFCKTESDVELLSSIQTYGRHSFSVPNDRVFITKLATSLILLPSVCKYYGTFPFYENLPLFAVFRDLEVNVLRACLPFEKIDVDTLFTCTHTIEKWKILLDAGAMMHHYNRITKKSIFNNIETVDQLDFLVSRGLNVLHTPSSNGNSLIHYVSDNFPVLERLVSWYQVPINVKNDKNEGAIDGNLTRKTLLFLVQNGAILSKPRNLLYLVRKITSLDDVKILAEHKVPITHIDFMHAAKSSPNVLKIFYDHGYNVFATDALFHIEWNLPNIKLYISMGADVFKTNNEGITAYSICKKMSVFNLLYKLYGKRIDSSKFQTANLLKKGFSLYLHKSTPNHYPLGFRARPICFVANAYVPYVNLVNYTDLPNVLCSHIASYVNELPDLSSYNMCFAVNKKRKRNLSKLKRSSKRVKTN